jgi:hypothetical protein
MMIFTKAGFGVNVSEKSAVNVVPDSGRVSRAFLPDLERQTAVDLLQTFVQAQEVHQGVPGLQKLGVGHLIRVSLEKFKPSTIS